MILSRSRLFSGLLAIAACTSLTAIANDAHADPSAAAVDEGRARFTKGVALFRGNDFRAALVEFRGAYAVAPSFRIQFNIGQTCAELQEHGCAARAFELFLADGGKQVPPAQRITAERELKRLHALVGSVRLVVSLAGAEVSVDGTPAGTSPIVDPLLVTAGKRKITASKPGLAPVSGTVDVTAGETADLTLTIDEAEHVAIPTTPGGESAPSRTPFWVGAGVTAALVVTTVTFGVLSLGAKSDLDSAVGRFGATAGDIDHARSKVDHLAVVTDVFGGLLLVSAGVTAYLFYRSRPSPTHVGVGPGWLSVTHAF